ncbi:hypothetical protein D3C75_886320 [compost metagenome]
MGGLLHTLHNTNTLPHKSKSEPLRPPAVLRQRPAAGFSLEGLGQSYIHNGLPLRGLHPFYAQPDFRADRHEAAEQMLKPAAFLPRFYPAQKLPVSRQLPQRAGVVIRFRLVAGMDKIIQRQLPIHAGPLLSHMLSRVQ